MMRYFLLLGGWILCWGSYSDPISYDASIIPATLKENAHAVVRESRYEFRVHRPDAATYRVHYAVTVLNQNGDRYAPLAIFYNQQHRITDIRCEVYDGSGRLVKKVKNKDLEDQSITRYSLYDNQRIKYYHYQTHDYPYTIVYSYEDEFDGLLYCPDWQPVAGFGLSVERSTLLVSSPVDAPCRFYVRNVPEEAARSSANGTITSTWSVANLLARQEELFQPDLSELTPTVLVAPTRFEFEKQAGDMQDWQRFGQWIYRLNTNRGQLPESTQRMVKQLVKDLPNTLTRVRALYEYMQSKTRYVSIQLGIGGFQPFEARTVDELGYGDCKALSNYMKSLLDAAGIASNYTLVKAGKNEADIITNFPSAQFNHAILCVPTDQDTLWLECTSQTDPFGYLGYFTSGRHVLLIDEAGGHLAKTPSYSQAQNSQLRRGTLHLDDEGNGTLDVTTDYAGLMYAHVDNVTRLPAVEQKKHLYQRIDLPNFNLLDYHYQPEKIMNPKMKEHLSLTMAGYASVSGKRWFINPNVMNRWTNVPPTRSDRRTDIVVPQAYVDIDSIEIILPEHIHPEWVPESRVIHSPFGEYQSTYTITQGKIEYRRTLKINQGIFPAEQYNQLVDFYQAVSQADQERIVLRKST